MSALSDFIADFLRGFSKALSKNQASSSKPTSQSKPALKPKQTQSTHTDELEPGRAPGSETIQLDPTKMKTVRITYAPRHDDDPDAGEVIWTWVPYEENDGRGKDRPVLVIGRQSATRVYAVRMTSQAHNGNRDYLPIGSGAWDSKGRESWVDIEQLYSVHVDGMRREASVLDQKRYADVAAALIKRYGWAVGD